jgi:hypothetical protein
VSSVVLTPISIGEREGLNLVAYVNNNPINHVDLWGLCCGNRFDQCSFTQFFLPQLWNNITNFQLVPQVDWGDASDLGDVAALGKQGIWAGAIAYAMNQGLFMPLKSSVYRGMVLAGEEAEAAILGWGLVGIVGYVWLITLWEQAECVGLVN